MRHDHCEITYITIATVLGRHNRHSVPCHDHRVDAQSMLINHISSKIYSQSSHTHDDGYLFLLINNLTSSIESDSLGSGLGLSITIIQTLVHTSSTLVSFGVACWFFLMVSSSAWQAAPCESLGPIVGPLYP